MPEPPFALAEWEVLHRNAEPDAAHPAWYMRAFVAGDWLPTTRPLMLPRLVITLAGELVATAEQITCGTCGQQPPTSELILRPTRGGRDFHPGESGKGLNTAGSCWFCCGRPGDTRPPDDPAAAGYLLPALATRLNAVFGGPPLSAI
jgi:hypothetical protein